MKSKPVSPNSKRTTRRQFTKAVATTLAAATLAQAQTPAKTKEPKEPAAQEQQPSSLVAAYLEVARSRFGDKLSPEQLEQLKKELDGYLRNSDRLRAVKLQNGDEPDFIFEP